jgi:hypothetical protein
MVKEKTMELWFQFLNIHNEFKDGLKTLLFYTNVKEKIHGLS